MPASGEQHQTGNDRNPFAEVKPHIREYTATEIASLSSRLEKQLGPEYISARPGAGGGKVHYLAADKCINLANEIFGFNGWSSSIQQIQVDFIDESPSSGKISLGLSVIVRVTLRDGTYHEDIGYGHIENCKGKAPAFEKAKKEGTTDALKRALRNFGNVLGNCVYDKEYVARVIRLKTAPSKWDPDSLHRHQNCSTLGPPVRSSEAIASLDRNRVKREIPNNRQESHEEDFGSDVFDEVDFAVPQEEEVDDSTLDKLLNDSCPDTEPQDLPPFPAFSERGARSETRNPTPPTFKHDPLSRSHAPPQPPKPTLGNDSSLEPSVPSAPSNPGSVDQLSANHDTACGFMTVRALDTPQQEGQGLKAVAPFNPRLESPSIRKTPGVDHTKTRPVIRDALGVPVPASSNAAPQLRPPTMGPNSALRPERLTRIGMPGMNSPLQNRGHYKPPSVVKRPAGGELERPPLVDVTAASINTNTNTNTTNERAVDRAYSALASTSASSAGADAIAREAAGAPDTKRPRLGHENMARA